MQKRVRFTGENPIPVAAARFFEACEKRLRKRLFLLRLAQAHRNPNSAAVRRLAIRLIALGRFDEAEALLRRGLERAPRDPDLLEQFAFCAHNSGRYSHALDRWHHLCALQPDRPMAWCGIASNARELQRLDEALDAIQVAQARFPDDIIVISEAARVQESRRAHVTAADLWARIVVHPLAVKEWRLAFARNLLKLRRFDEVEKALAALLTPDDGDAVIARRIAIAAWGECADAAAEANRVELRVFLEEAERRFGDAAFAVRQVAETTPNHGAAREALRCRLDLVPSDTVARQCLVRVLIRSDLLDEAEQEIALGLRLTPGDDGLAALRGLIAVRQFDWDGAHRTLSAYAISHPHDIHVASAVERVERMRRLEQADAMKNAPRPAPIAPAICDEPETRSLLLRFESIGATCEFGGVQRRYGAEPLGLLRWTDTNISSLMAALAARFAGMGDPACTELTVGPLGEIYIRDTRWNLAMHTFMFEEEVSLAALLPKMCRRTAYLRDKFLGDLRDGRKTLVFTSGSVGCNELVALHDAFLAFGPVRLLNVRLVSGSGDFTAEEPGSVREIRAGLLVGHLSRISVADPAYDEWVAVCRAAAALSAASDGSALQEAKSSAA